MAFRLPGFLKNDQPLVAEAGKAGFKPKIWLLLLIFLGVYLLPLMLSNDFGSMFSRVGSLKVTIRNLMLLIPTATCLLYVLKIEKRSWSSMGFIRKKAFRQYIYGFLLAAAMISLSVGIGLVTGTLEYGGRSHFAGGLGAAVLMLAGWMIQGLSEEVAFRGYLTVSMANRTPVVWAILLSSLVFGLLHILSGTVWLIGLLNLMVFGVYYALFFLRMGNIWNVAAQHAAWNFFYQNIYGMGTGRVDGSVFLFDPDSSKFPAIKGFLMYEYELIVLFIFLLAILAVLFVPKKGGSDTAGQMT